MAIGFSVLTQLYKSHDLAAQELAQQVVILAAQKTSLHELYEDPIIKACAECIAPVA